MNNTINNTIKEVTDKDVTNLEEAFLRTRDSDKETQLLLVTDAIEREEAKVILHDNRVRRAIIRTELKKKGYDLP